MEKHKVFDLFKPWNILKKKEKNKKIDVWEHDNLPP